MRSTVLTLCALALVASVAGIANAAGKTDKAKFDKALSKFAPTFDQLFGIDSPFKPKGLCVCTAGADATHAGFLYREGTDEKVYCAWPIFSPDGSFAKVAVPCSPFEVLSK